MLSIALSSTKVAAALADRLRAKAPVGIDVTAEGCSLLVMLGANRWAASVAPAILDHPQGWEPGEEFVLLESVAYSALSGVQDVICEATAECWPPQPGDPNALAEPGARVVGDALTLWFGNPVAPLLALSPIALVDLA